MLRNLWACILVCLSFMCTAKSLLTFDENKRLLTEISGPEAGAFFIDTDLTFSNSILYLLIHKNHIIYAMNKKCRESQQWEGIIFLYFAFIFPLHHCKVIYSHYRKRYTLAKDNFPLQLSL